MGKMARPRQLIPEEDIKGLTTLLAEGNTPAEISEYYRGLAKKYDFPSIGGNRITVTSRIREMKNRKDA